MIIVLQQFYDTQNICSILRAKKPRQEKVRDFSKCTVQELIALASVGHPIALHFTPTKYTLF